MYEIDLRMKACAECGYKCCQGKHKHLKCFKPIFTGEYCTRNALTICKSYPLSYDGERFIIHQCQGVIPFELIRIVKELNNELPDEYHHESEELSLKIINPTMKKKIEPESLLHELLKQ